MTPKRMRARRFSRLRLPLLWVTVVLVLGFSINAYLALRPANLRAAVAAQLRDLFQPPVQLEDCTFGIRRGVEVGGLRVANPVASVRSADASQILEAPRVRIIPDFSELLRGNFRVKKVIVESPRLSLRRRAGGGWNFDGLFRQRGGGAPDLPHLSFRRATLVYEDASTSDQPRREVLRDVDVELSPSREGSLVFSCSVALEGVRKLEFDGTLVRAPTSQGVNDEPAWAGRVRIQALKVDVGKCHERFLPAALAGFLRECGLQGFVDLEGELRLDPAGGIRPGAFSGRLVGGAMKVPDAPLAVRNMSCAFSGTRERLMVTDMEGDLADGALSGTATVGWTETGFTVASWSSRLRVKGLTVDGRLRSLVPLEQQSLFDRLRPRGRASVDLRVGEGVEFPPSPGRTTATVRLEGLDLRLEPAGYELANLHGELALVDGRLNIAYPIAGVVGDTQFSISGTGMELAPGGSVDVTVKVQNFPLDDKARSMLKPTGQIVWDSLRLSGAVDLTVNLTRTAAVLRADDVAPEPVRVLATAYCRGVRLSYDRFPYEISGITGMATFDSQSDQLALIDLKGAHGSQVIEGKGLVLFSRPERPGQLRLDLHCDSLEVDEDLVAALAPEARELIEYFSFRGRAEADVTILTVESGGMADRTDPTGRRRIEVVTSVDLIEGEVQPTHFPYRFELAGGHMRVVGAETIEFKGVRTHEDARPYVVFDGDLVTPDSGHKLTFDLEVTRLPFDKAFTDALPAELRDFVTNFGLEGVFDGRIEGECLFNEEDPSNFGLIYHAYDLKTTDAAVDFGLKIRRMIAQGDLVGRKEPGKRHFFLGNVMVDSALFNRLELTKGDIRFVYGREHDAIVSAREGRLGGGDDYVPPGWMLDRLREEKVGNTFQMIVHSPDLYGGQVDGFMYVDTGTERDIGGDLVGSNLHLAKAAVDVFGVAGTGTEGLASGSVSFSGETGDLSTLKGEGKGKIEQAKLVELPLFLGILALLFGEGSDRQYFNEILLKFAIADEKFVAASEGLTISSSALKLVGSGYMDFAGNLDIRLLPRIFSLKIIVLEQLSQLLKKGLAEIVVGGSLNDPRVALATAAGLLRFDFDVSSGGDGGPRLPSDQRPDAESENTPEPTVDR